MLKKTDFKRLEKKLYLASPTMHGEELQFMAEAYHTNWMSTVGANINEVERLSAEATGARHAVALSAGTAAIHLAFRAAAADLFGASPAGGGMLSGHTVFSTDVTFAATSNPILYEGGTPVFIDTERESWNMDPRALEKAFELYPETKIVIMAHLYGTPARLDEITQIINSHDAILIEDAAESLGASYRGRQTGSFGRYNVLSFNGNKIITGTSGGCLLTDDADAAARIRKWSQQSRENAPWYQHEELGYNYRMSNIVAGVVRGQFPHLQEHIEQKKKIYMRYKEAFKDLPVKMNPIPENCEANYWLSCLLINEDAMCRQDRTDKTFNYQKECGKTCPQEILDALALLDAEGRPIWKPMHQQPTYRKYPFITAEGEAVLTKEQGTKDCSVSADIFDRGLCLPSDNKMTPEIQDRIIDVIRACFE